MSINGTSLRPTLNRRKSYVRVRGVLDSFIVPLLREAIQGEIENLADMNAEAQVLDVGCGEQPFRSCLERHHYRYHGMDIQQNASCTVDSIGPLDEAFPSVLHSRFDLILCTEVLEHVANWPAAFLNISTALKPGGRAILTCPFVYPLHELPHDYWRPTPYAIDWYAKQHGLTVLASKRLGTGWDVLGTILGNLLGIKLGGPQPCHPGIVSWFITLIAKVGLIGIYTTLRTGLFQRFVRFHSPRNPIYQSTLAILQRPIEPNRADS